MRNVTEEVLLEWPLAKVTRESDGHMTVIRKVVHPHPFDYIRQCMEIDSYASSLGVTPTWLGMDAEERSFLFEDLGSLGGDEVLAEGAFDVAAFISIYSRYQSVINTRIQEQYVHDPEYLSVKFPYFFGEKATESNEHKRAAEEGFLNEFGENLGAFCSAFRLAVKTDRQKEFLDYLRQSRIVRDNVQIHHADIGFSGQNIMVCGREDYRIIDPSFAFLRTSEIILEFQYQGYRHEKFESNISLEDSIELYFQENAFCSQYEELHRYMEHLILGDLLACNYSDFFQRNALPRYVDWTREKITDEIKHILG